jgi:hypothetical protein
MKHLLWFALVAALTHPGWSSETYTDSPSTWTGPLSGGSASGHCTVECQNPTRGTNVRFHASGLSPQASFSAFWIDVDGKAKPLGMHPTQWHADGHGELDFQARLPQCPEGPRLRIVLKSNGQEILSGTIEER